MLVYVCKCSQHQSVLIFGSRLESMLKYIEDNFDWIFICQLAGCSTTYYWTDGIRKSGSGSSSIWHWEHSDQRIVFPQWYLSVYGNSGWNWLASRRYTGSSSSYTSWGLYNSGSTSTYCYTCEIESLVWAEIYTGRQSSIFTGCRQIHNSVKTDLTHMISHIF